MTAATTTRPPATPSTALIPILSDARGVRELMHKLLTGEALAQPA